MIAETPELFKEVSEAILTDFNSFVEPYGQALPDACYATSLQQLVVGLLAARSPHLTKAAAQTPDQTTAV